MATLTDLTSRTDFVILIQEIKMKFDTLILNLSDRKQALLTQVETLRAEYELQTKRAEAVKEIENMIEQNKNMRVENSIAIQKKNETIENMKRDLISLKDNLTAIRKLEFDIDMKSIQETIATLGHIDVRPEDTHTSVDYTTKINPIMSIGKLGKGQCEFNNPLHIALNEKSNKIYISDCYNGRIQVLNFNFEFLTAFGKEDMIHPSGMAIYGNFLIVSDFSLKVILKYELPKYRLVAKNSMTHRERLKNPRGMASDDNGNIYVAEFNGNRVSNFDKNLKFKRYIGEKKLFYPSDIALIQDNIYVLDRASPNIHVYKTNGTLLSSIIKLSDGKGSLSMCVDKMYNILVSDSNARSIQIFSVNGDFIHSITHESDHPRGIAVTNNQSIICAYIKTGRLVVY